MSPQRHTTQEELILRKSTSFDTKYGKYDSVYL